ncbi:MAG TPA: threonylcarbamoyl-AMP synthase [Bacteroidetes bacterium]|jgi:L-threonylcarbamoyladenylate synthase|nr:threonylcarbamoyl-AMP synthase [Bacteroidota bacterium]|tara:strand:- start:8075 stop:9025 length:951 start_codon:yes stop_codon:yes gene_type:complete
MIGTDLALATSLLQNGQLVAIPTETVYGLAANILDINALTKIYEAKQRPSFNPLIVHISSITEVEKYTTHFPPSARLLAEIFWPGSLSILLPKNNVVPDLVTAGSQKVVLRVPNHALTLALLKNLDFPLAAPSANLSNTVSPTNAQHVESALGRNIGYVLDGGPCIVGVESTIVEVIDDIVFILREGGISQEEITAKTGLIVRTTKEGKTATPGHFLKHYATVKPLYMVDDIEAYSSAHSAKKISYLLYENKEVNGHSYYLSHTYELAEIASNLFAMMHQADEDHSDCIVVEKIREEGIGRAIADRLSRAAFAHRK